MREVIIRVRDDLDREALADKTIAFAFDGTSYEIDLTAQHCDEFEAALQPYIAAARIMPTHGGRRKRVDTINAAHGGEQNVTSLLPKRSRSNALRDEKRGKSLRDKIRAWGNANGYTVASTGIIPRDVVDAYNAAEKPARA